MHKTDIDRINRLSDLFYEGKTSRVEETELRNLLDRVDSCAVSEDVRDDWSVLREILSPGLPYDVAARMEDTIDKLAAMDDRMSETAMSESRSGKFRIALWWGCSVAAAVIMAVMLVPLSHKGLSGKEDMFAHQFTYTGYEMVGEAKVLAFLLSEKNAGHHTDADALVEDRIGEGDAQPERKNVSPKKPKVSTGVRSHTPEMMVASTSVARSNDNVKEVTDPAEARLLLDRAFSRIYRNMTLAESSVSRTTRIVSDGGIGGEELLLN